MPKALKPVSKFVSVKNRSQRLSDEINTNALDRIGERWNVIRAVCDYNDTSCIEFSELKNKIQLCNVVHIDVLSLKNPESPISIRAPDVINYYCPQEEKTFIDYSCDDDLLLYLKQKTQLSAALIGNILDADTVKELKRILKKEGFPENILEKYKLLTNRSKFKKEKLEVISEKSAAEALDNFRPKRSGSSRRRSAARISSGNPKSRGHLRASDDAGRSYVPAYDDESTENQKIGDKAEKYVVALLQDDGKEDARQMEANNKGYDIEYEENGVTKFVEVKGLRDSWDRADVMMSRSQFEKAQLEKENFSLYVVENVDSDGNETRPSHTVIINPASRFTKIQLDAGWKDFDNDSDDLKPKAGLYVSFTEQPDKGRQKIIDVVANGRKIVLADDKKFLYQSNKMLIHNEPEDDD